MCSIYFFPGYEFGAFLEALDDYGRHSVCFLQIRIRQVNALCDLKQNPLGRSRGQGNANIQTTSMWTVTCRNQRPRHGFVCLTDPVAVEQLPLKVRDSE